MKRIVSAFLILVLLLGCCAFSAAAAEDVVRYSVLILDSSGSMSGTPAAKQKTAAIKFCDAVLKAAGENYVAIVKLNSSSTAACQFTQDLDTLTNCINSIPASGGTNINEALEAADQLLDGVTVSGAIKNIVLCSDGLPEHGDRSYDGPYTSADSTYYGQANACYNTAAALKGDSYIYTLGFFHSLSGSNRTFAVRFMEDLQNAGYYEVTDPEDLEFTFGDIAGDITQPGGLQRITFTYQSGKDYTATCYYTDDYFSESAYTYNQSLGTMSLALAMSAFGSAAGGYSDKSANARALLEDIGVVPEDIDTNDWFTVKPTTDSIGVIAGHKTIGEGQDTSTLIALAVRGGGYEREWASNFTIGSYGRHDGFDTAKDNVLAFLRDYVEEQGITGSVKFWITGFSRAAATANLVGGALDDGTTISEEITYDCSDIYTYCFETPAGALTSKVTDPSRIFTDNEAGVCHPLYDNIFNIINSSDPVPYVAPAALGFGRYGVDRYLPSAEADADYARYQGGKLVGGKLYDMLEVYNALPSTDSYVVDQFQMKKLGLEVDVDWDWFDTSVDMNFILDDTKNKFSQGVFLSNYVTILSREFLGSRSNYVALYQDEIREICSVVFGCTEAQSKAMTESLVAQAKDEWGALAWSYVYNTGVKGLIGAGDEDAALQIVSDWLNEAIQTAGITDYDADVIDRAGKNLGDLFLALVSNHPNYFTTALLNIEGLGAAHYPELCFAWMASMDPNYDKSNNASFNNGSYRIIRINCQVDVTVRDASGQEVASIINEVPQQTTGSILSAINENGEKIIVLPADSSYSISILGREDDLVNYGINEYCALAGSYTRALNYFQIPLSAGQSLTGSIPAYSSSELEDDTPGGSSAAYTLYAPDGQLLTAASDLTGTAASSAYYTVTVRPDDETHGVTLGSSTFQYGSFAQVEAFANKGYAFAGWYDDQTLVSTEATYRFCVTNNVDLTARFTPVSGEPTIPTLPGHAITVDADNGTVTTTPARAEAGETVTINATPNAGYEIGSITVTSVTGETIAVSGNRFTMPNASVTVKVTFVKTASPFSDVTAGDWFYEEVLWAYENNVMDGIGGGKFGPNSSVSRAMVWTVLARIDGKAISGSDWADEARAWAMAEGVSDGTMSTGNVTREQLATMLYRYAKSQGWDVSIGESTNLLSYPDADQVSDWAMEAMQWACGAGIINGMDGELNPKGGATRAQLAAMLMRFDSLEK